MSETDYYQHTLELLEDSYVTADERGDLAGGSGSGGGLARWQRKRKVIAAAFDHDGTWLDVGCANGLLMETLCRWAADRKVRVEPYGLELSQRVAQRARLRLTRWAERIWSGNVMTWMPPMRFDYVTLLPEFVPTELRGAMLVRVRDQFLKPAGRLIVSSYRPGAAPGQHRHGAPSAPLLLCELGFVADGFAEVQDEDGTLWTSVAWLDRKLADS
jgi:2-polyprenyl-3-methyl-5-hydroxy-6-metoxy-1,4-benzoquinol methylase